jgi:hypothetical protein
MSWLMMLLAAIGVYAIYKYATTDHFSMPGSTIVIIVVSVFAVLALWVYFSVLRRE